MGADGAAHSPYNLNVLKRFRVSVEQIHFTILRILVRRNAEAARVALQPEIAVGTVMVSYFEGWPGTDVSASRDGGRAKKRK